MAVPPSQLAPCSMAAGGGTARVLRRNWLIDLDASADPHCRMRNEETQQISYATVSRAVLRSRGAIFAGRDYCSAGAFLVGDVNGDRVDDAVVEAGCGDPSADLYAFWPVVFLGDGKGGLALAQNATAEVMLQLDELCDGILEGELPRPAGEAERRRLRWRRGRLVPAEEGDRRAR
ncbi:MAG: hypothetical protein HOO96_40400 [Polyangiaceae bacterium]|nr:hypothetical protein [Polyangiaceae bacterium]